MNSNLVCPKCGSSNVKPILWGLPLDPVDENQYIIGGCCMVPELDHGCLDCDYRWGMTTFNPEDIKEIIFLEKDLETKNKKNVIVSLPRGLAQSSCGNTWILTDRQIRKIREEILPPILRPLYMEPYSDHRTSTLFIKAFLPDGRFIKTQVDVPGEGLGQIYHGIFGTFEEK
ncbi:MAG: hypothetical protein Q4P25_02095 [Tissierellia bacterium]|nr:hypothetical protein [Tissierellia bacterium]